MGLATLVTVQEQITRDLEKLQIKVIGKDSLDIGLVWFTGNNFQIGIECLEIKFLEIECLNIMFDSPRETGIFQRMNEAIIFY